MFYAQTLLNREFPPVLYNLFYSLFNSKMLTIFENFKSNNTGKFRFLKYNKTGSLFDMKKYLVWHTHISIVIHTFKIKEVIDYIVLEFCSTLAVI